MTSPGSLCSTCRSEFSNPLGIAKHSFGISKGRPPLLPLDRLRPFLRTHHRDNRTLRQAADDECFVCHRLYEQLTLAAKSDDTFMSVLYHWCLTSTSSENMVPAAITLILIPASITTLRETLYFDLVPTTVVNQTLGMLTFTTLESDPRTEYLLRIQTASTWLRCCLNDHVPCAFGRNRQLPTRLVRVDRSDGDVYSRPQARLVSSTEVSADTLYLTLSHCWGSEPFLTLTRDNFDQMRLSIPVAELKPVFQDAMWATLELGFHHIWIDSLCIIQDSPGTSDWLHESATMDRVYGNSTCNLAATGFPDGNQGLFQPMGKRGTLIPPEITLGTMGSYSILCSDDWRHDVKDGPLHKRGWVLQEQIMAPRILHFTTRQMYWECPCQIASEVFPTDLLRIFQYYIDNLKLSIRMPKILTNQYGNDQVHRQWRYIVREYSQALLTRPTDKFPALSGLAKVFMRNLDGEYIAGLWKPDLFRDLLWYSRSSQSRPPPTDFSYAPTWSWASVNAGITHLGFKVPGFNVCQPLARLLEAFIVPVGNDTTGEIKHAHLQLSGRLQRLDTSRVSGSFIPGSYKIEFQPSEAQLQSPLPPVLVASASSDKIFRTFSSFPNHRWGSEVTIVPLLCFRNPGNSGRDYYDAHGLLLEHQAGSVGIYTKCGVVHIGDEDVLKKLLSVERDSLEGIFQGGAVRDWSGMVEFRLV